METKVLTEDEFWATRKVASLWFPLVFQSSVLVVTDFLHCRNYWVKILSESRSNRSD